MKSMFPNVVNIGLNINGARKITPKKAVSVLEKLGISIPKFSVQQSNTEQTLVAGMSRALTAREAFKVSSNLKQDAIAQYANGKGGLYGPKAKNWGRFNPKFFLAQP